ncbi:MAG: response regulator [Deltaproteobacteria bacterium]|nr:response regulator [Deltaproteobacteria bacterium]
MKQTPEITILLVDDSRTIRHQIKSILAKRGFRILEAENGSAAIRIAHREKPDIALMDVQMPLMNGFQCCAQMKSDPDLKHIRVIMVTSENGYANLSQAYKMGCNDYINKPVVETELLEKLNKVVRFVRIARTAKNTISEKRKRLETDD